MFSGNFSFSLCVNTEPNAAARAHLNLCKLHISAVQVAIESSQVPRRIHTVTKSHFAQELLTDMGFFALSKHLLLHLSFPPSYVRCSTVLPPSLSVSVSLSLSLSLLLEETHPGNCICSGSKVQQTHMLKRPSSSPRAVSLL